LQAVITGRGPFVTSIVGEIEVVRVCRRVNVPAERIDEARAGLAIVALDDEVRELAFQVGSPTLRSLDAIHLATALSLRASLEAFVTYDLRLIDAARQVELRVVSPS
jgi:predicted nucleic acid-binding protein